MTNAAKPTHTKTGTGNSNSKPKPPTQAERIIRRLKQGSATTWDFIQLGIVSPNARVCELRKRGYPIVTVMETTTDQYGQEIQRGRFTLMKQGQKTDAYQSDVCVGL